jgi:hypothetical protein
MSRQRIDVTFYRLITTTVMASTFACQPASSLAAPTPVLDVSPDPVLHLGAVVDDERKMLGVGSIRVCAVEAWVRVRFSAKKDVILPSRPVTVRLSKRGKRRIVFGAEAPSAEHTCVLLDAPAGEYDLWIAGDGPTAITVRRGYIDSLSAVVDIPVALPRRPHKEP